MIVRRTRVLYRTKLFRGLRHFAGHRFRHSRVSFQRLFRDFAGGLFEFSFSRLRFYGTLRNRLPPPGSSN